jgi:hypothetical protein
VRHEALICREDLFLPRPMQRSREAEGRSNVEMHARPEAALTT